MVARDTSIGFSHGTEKWSHAADDRFPLPRVIDAHPPSGPALAAVFCGGHREPAAALVAEGRRGGEGVVVRALPGERGQGSARTARRARRVAELPAPAQLRGPFAA